MAWMGLQVSSVIVSSDSAHKSLELCFGGQQTIDDQRMGEWHQMLRAGWTCPLGGSAQQSRLFLGTGAVCQPGSVYSSDCFGNVNNVNQNGRLMSKEDRASCWAMAIMNLLLNVSYHCLPAQLSELSGKHILLHNFHDDMSIRSSSFPFCGKLETWISIYLWQRNVFSQHCWECFPASPVVLECLSFSVSSFFFFYNFIFKSFLLLTYY